MNSVNILALESSTPTLGVGLLQVNEQGQQSFIQREFHGSSQHAEQILPLVDEVLAQAALTPQDITVIAFGQGPGGFTGLRVACGVAQGMAFGLQRPVVAVPSLLAVAQAAQQPAEWIQVVLLDARMNELYVAAYRRDRSQTQPSSALSRVHNEILGWQVVHEPILIEAQYFPLWLEEQRHQWGQQHVALHGNGLEVYQDNYGALPEDEFLHRGAAWVPQVRAVAELAWEGWQRKQTIAAEHAAPVYIRDKVAFTIAERAQGLGGNPAAGWQPIQLIPLQAAHIPQLMQLAQITQAAQWSEQQWRSGLEAGQFGWGLMRGDKMCAFLWASQAATESELLLMATDPQYRRRGYATWLLNTWQHHVEQRAVTQLNLEVRASNSAAQQLYEGFGFERVGARAHYYPQPTGGREDAYLYTKWLAVE